MQAAYQARNPLKFNMNAPHQWRGAAKTATLLSGLSKRDGDQRARSDWLERLAVLCTVWALDL